VAVLGSKLKPIFPYIKTQDFPRFFHKVAKPSRILVESIKERKEIALSGKNRRDISVFGDISRKCLQNYLKQDISPLFYQIYKGLAPV
jgi:hypothetical protein